MNRTDERTNGRRSALLALLTEPKNNFLLKHPPWTILQKDSKGEIVEASGVVFEVLDQISYKLNFTYNVREPEDGSYDAMIQKVAIPLSRRI